MTNDIVKYNSKTPTTKESRDVATRSGSSSHYHTDTEPSMGGAVRKIACYDITGKSSTNVKGRLRSLKNKTATTSPKQINVAPLQIDNDCGKSND